MENRESYIFLLKYPVIIFSVIMGLSLAHLVLDIDFSRITKISTSGVEFSQNDIQNATGELQQRIEQLELMIASLQGKVESEPNSSSSVKQVPVNELDIFSKNLEKIQTVSDNIANLSYQSEQQKQTIYESKSGYIWIGDFNETENKWTKMQLRSGETKEKLEMTPDKIDLDQTYEVRGNMVLRSEKPNDNLSYYKSIKRKGVIPRGTPVRIVEEPIAFKRNHIVQYWVKIRVEN